MADDIRSLIKEHRACFEVSPYYVMFDQRPVGSPETARKVHAGFDIDVYGERTANDSSWLPAPGKYALGCAELQKIAENVSRHATGLCLLEVIPSRSTVVFDARDQWKMKATFRLRISHGRGLDQPAGLPEYGVLEAVAKELKNMGFSRR